MLLGIYIVVVVVVVLFVGRYTCSFSRTQTTYQSGYILRIMLFKSDKKIFGRSIQYSGIEVFYFVLLSTVIYFVFCDTLVLIALLFLFSSL